MPSMGDLRTRDPERYALFNKEATRVEEEIAILMKSVSKDQQIEDAFRTLQEAEDARDKAPEAYQMARIAYYTLTKGSGWIDEEKKRIASAEIDPEIRQYRTALDEANNRKNLQQRTQDVMRSVKDGVLSIKDDVQYTTKTFQNQIDLLKNQINIERRGREQPVGADAPFFKWIDTILNLLIVVGLVYAGYLIWQKASKTMAYVPPTSLGQ